MVAEPFVKEFHTPTLVIHGELDFRVPFDQGLQLFTALQMQKVPSKLLVFPDEGHWVLKPQNSILWYKTVHRLDRFLGKKVKAIILLVVLLIAGVDCLSSYVRPHHRGHSPACHRRGRRRRLSRCSRQSARCAARDGVASSRRRAYPVLRAARSRPPRYVLAVATKRPHVTFEAGKNKAPNLKDGKARLVVEAVSNDFRGARIHGSRRRRSRAPAARA